MKTPAEYAASGTEFAHQAALFQWCNVAAKFGLTAANTDYSYTKPGLAVSLLQTYSDTVPVLEWLYAVKNAGHGDAIRGARSAAEGVKAGVPDLCLPISSYGKHALFIEMKRPGSEGKRKGVGSDAQEKWQAFLRNSGYAVEVCFGWEAARNAILKYLGY